MFKAARLLSPAGVNSLHPGKAVVEELRRFPFLDNDHMIGGRLVELPNYLAPAEDVGEEVDSLQWRTTHRQELPVWVSVFEKLILVQPSSAATERVFSLLNALFHDQQDNALKEASAMVQYDQE